MLPSGVILKIFVKNYYRLEFERKVSIRSAALTDLFNLTIPGKIVFLSNSIYLDFNFLIFFIEK
jgi:hypothetical protein